MSTNIKKINDMEKDLRNTEVKITKLIQIYKRKLNYIIEEEDHRYIEKKGLIQNEKIIVNKKYILQKNQNNLLNKISILKQNRKEKFSCKDYKRGIWIQLTIKKLKIRDIQK